MDANRPGTEPLEPRILTLLPADGTPVSNSAMQAMLASELEQPVDHETVLKACERLAEYRIIGTLPGEIYLLTDVEPRASAPADPSVESSPEAEITASPDHHREEKSQEETHLAKAAHDGDVVQNSSAAQSLAAAAPPQPDGGDPALLDQDDQVPLDQTRRQLPAPGRPDGSLVPLRRGHLVLALGIVLALGTILLLLPRERAAERKPQPAAIVDIAPLSKAGLSDRVDARPQPTPGAPQRPDETPPSPAAPEQAVELGQQAPLPAASPSDPNPALPNVSETPSPPGPAPIPAMPPGPATQPKPSQASPPQEPTPKLQAKRKPDSKLKSSAERKPKPGPRPGAERKP